MKLIKNVAKAIVISALVLGTVACGGKKSSGGEFESIYPPQITALINGPYRNAIYAVGMGTHPQRQMAERRASIDADARIAEQFGAEIASLTKDFMEGVNDQMIQQTQRAAEVFAREKITGLQTIEVVMRKDSEGRYEAMVLKAINPTMLKDFMEQQRDEFTEFRASQAYKDLDARVRAHDAANR